MNKMPDLRVNYINLDEADDKPKIGLVRDLRLASDSEILEISAAISNDGMHENLARRIGLNKPVFELPKGFAYERAAICGSKDSICGNSVIIGCGGFRQESNFTPERTQTILNLAGVALSYIFDVDFRENGSLYLPNDLAEKEFVRRRHSIYGDSLRS